MVAAKAMGVAMALLAASASAMQENAQCAAVPKASRLPCGIYETRADNIHGKCVCVRGGMVCVCDSISGNG